jgi:hypothetical protein
MLGNKGKTSPFLKGDAAKPLGVVEHLQVTLNFERMPLKKEQNKLGIVEEFY